MAVGSLAVPEREEAVPVAEEGEAEALGAEEEEEEEEEEEPMLPQRRWTISNPSIKPPDPQWSEQGSPLMRCC